jgi:hypothetical protein
MLSEGTARTGYLSLFGLDRMCWDYGDLNLATAALDQRLRHRARHNPEIVIRHLMPSSALASFLQKAGLVRDENPVLVAELFGDEPAQIITGAVVVEHHIAHQSLHPIGCLVPGVLGQPPRILAFHRRQQPHQHVPAGTTRFDPPEPTGDEAERLLERLPPHGGVYDQPNGRRVFITVHNGMKTMRRPSSRPATHARTPIVIINLGVDHDLRLPY